MYRRIEIINHFKQQDGSTFHYLQGLCGLSEMEVALAWTQLNVPRKRIFKNVRFYFTEKGWKKYGRNTVAACIRSGQDYRVIAVEEHTVDVMYIDEYQVCIRPKRKARRGRR